LEFLNFFLPLGGAVIAWFWNERKKRAWDEYQRKESNYKELILAMKGLYPSTDAHEGKQLKSKFIHQISLCGLYPPDNVILALNRFIDAINLSADEPGRREKLEEAWGSFMLAIRKDLVSHRITRTTELKSKDFKLLIVD
jgi:hypothetical protein